MKTKLGASLIAALMMLGLFGAASATADPGPNGNNEKGLCTAFFNGQKNGHNKDGKASPAPFAALEDVADEEDGEDGADSGDRLEIAGDVFGFCQEFGIGGNPTNGRYSCAEDGDSYTCENNTEGTQGKGPKA